VSRSGIVCDSYPVLDMHSAPLLLVTNCCGRLDVLKIPLAAVFDQCLLGYFYRYTVLVLKITFWCCGVYISHGLYLFLKDDFPLNVF